MSLKLTLLSIIIYLFFGCSKDDKNNKNDFNSNYLNAKVNEISRDFECYAQLDYNYDRGYHLTTIHSFNKKFSDGKTRDIYLNISQAPRLGTFIFNNVGISINDAGGSYREWDDNSDITYYSIDGFVNITSFTKTKIEGTFEFNAKPNTNVSDQIATIKDGKFEASISSVRGQSWNGI
jgi:hypothetical protein